MADGVSAIDSSNGSRGPLPGDGRAIRSVALQFWVNGAVFSSFIPRLPELRDQIGVNSAGLGLVVTLGSLGGLVGSVSGGRLIARFGSKWTMTAGAAGMIVSLPLIGWANSPIMLLVVLALLGAFDAVTDMSMNLQGAWISSRRRVPIMSRLHGLWSVGMLMGGAATSVAAAQFSLQTHLVLVSLVLAAALIYVTPGLLPRDEVVASVPAGGTDTGRGGSADDHPDTAGTAGPAGTEPSGAEPSGADSPVSHQSVRRLGAGFALLAVAMIGLELVPSDWSAIRLTDDFGVSAGWAGLGFVALSGGMVVSRLGGDTAAARLGPRRLARHATVVATIGLVLGTLIPVPAIAVAGFALCGLGGGVLFPRLYEEAARAPGRPGAMLGALTAGIRIGIVIMPVSVGALATTSLSVGAAMAIVALPGAVILLVLRERLANATATTRAPTRR